LGKSSLGRVRSASPQNPERRKTRGIRVIIGSRKKLCPVRKRHEYQGILGRKHKWLKKKGKPKRANGARGNHPIPAKEKKGQVGIRLQRRKDRWEKKQRVYL